MNFLIVGLGSAAGGMTRYGVGLLMARLGLSGFPYGTIFVNLIGSFIIATMTAYVAMRPEAVNIRVADFVLIGFCGGLTTYSSFNEQTLELFRSGQAQAAALNMVVTLIGCVFAGYLGFTIGNLLSGK